MVTLTLHRASKARLLASVALLLMGLGMLGFSHAALVTADFNDLSPSGSDLQGKGGGSGFSGNWISASNQIDLNAGDLSYANYTLTQSVGTANKITSGVNVRQTPRTVAAAMSGEVWFTILANTPASNDYAGISFNYRGNTYDPLNTDVTVWLQGTSLNVRQKNNGGGGAISASNGTGTHALATTHLLLGRMVIGAGADSIDVWVDPDLTGDVSLGDLGTANFSDNTIDFGVIDGTYSYLENVGVAAFSGGQIDALRVSDTGTAFADVTGVNLIPEPSSFALLGMAGFGLLLRRRRN